MRFLQRLRALANMRLRRSAVVLVDEQRRHKKDAALGHALEMARVLGEITAVLDRIDAGLDRNVEASPAECMAHDAAVERMRLVDERLHLVEIEGAVARPVPLTRAGTAGRGAFDDVGAGPHHLAHDIAYIGDARHDARRDQRVTGDAAAIIERQA